jgi:hypothetical protein
MANYMVKEGTGEGVLMSSCNVHGGKEWKRFCMGLSITKATKSCYKMKSDEIRTCSYYEQFRIEIPLDLVCMLPTARY